MASNQEPVRRVPTIQLDQAQAEPEQEQVRPSVESNRSSLEVPRGSTKDRNRQLMVFTDPVAFRYLEEDPCTSFIAKERELNGYEMYLVEQWACSRAHPSFIITTYSGDPSHTIKVGVLSVPIDEEAWSARLKIYFKALNQYHARRRETPLGTLMITNLSSFPSSLTCIPIPDGEVKKHRLDFVVNENLKRLGCSGRVGLTLSTPSPATQAKFHQLYRTSDKLRLYDAVIEIVKLCQVALMLFDVLDAEYVDGLLCDVTEKAVNDWWIEFGAEYYNVEPHDGILGPTTVAALLGMLMGARNRLNAWGANIAKDVFDIDSTKRAIAYFQKSMRMHKSRRLDRQTLERLHRATAKEASGDKWTGTRALKSTVAELGGKGGEMVMDFVGVRDKAGVADIETVDYELFVQLVKGERAKWLWYGKPRKSNTGDIFNRLPDQNLVLEKNDAGGYSWSGVGRKQSADIREPLRKRDTFRRKNDKEDSSKEDVSEIDWAKDAGTLTRTESKKQEGRSGMGRFKDAVSFRGHHHKLSKDDYDANSLSPIRSEDTRKTLRRMKSAPDSPTKAGSFEKPTRTDTVSTQQDTPSELHQEPTFAKVISETPQDSQSSFFFQQRSVSENDKQPPSGVPFQNPATTGSRPPTAGSSIAGSTYRGIDLEDLFADDDEVTADVGPFLRRAQSMSGSQGRKRPGRNEGWWPRHLSFSMAEDSLLIWDTSQWDTVGEPYPSNDPKKQLAKELIYAEDTRRVREAMAEVQTGLSRYVNEKVGHLTKLEALEDRDQQELDNMYYSRMEEYHALREDSNETLQQERARLLEGVKDMEVLGARLEYEINGLRSKVDDVESGVAEFERQVQYIEGRVAEFGDDSKSKEGWLQWAMKNLKGVGKSADPGVS
ncbi:hypothetical protein K402DRAFT_419397 [Aulographum hederae CBS 113979]|uniref:STB6-like N-terminal domain-containing protein n=1 Tax=Aulographum hederae CBS 113979 TaxID=1176131 RepID=A0A6G1H5R3_9PEZI|nr:hypothetical protein K402DRAFT_419397 [Aulographum hederae CBS 113979]